MRSAVNRCEPALEQLLFLAHALHHVLDDVLVLAAQRAELGQLLGDAVLPGVEERADARGERLHLGLRRRADDVALGRNELARQRVLEDRAAGSSRAARRRR